MRTLPALKAVNFGKSYSSTIREIIQKSCLEASFSIFPIYLIGVSPKVLLRQSYRTTRQVRSFWNKFACVHGNFARNVRPACRFR